MSEIFTGAFWRFPHQGWRHASQQEEFRVGNHRLIMSISKMSQNVQRKGRTAPPVEAKNPLCSGAIYPQQCFRYKKITGSPPPLFKYRCLISAKTA